MVKIEAFYKFHFMHLAVRVCRTDHNDSIIARIACSFLLNKLPESIQKLLGYSLGIVKIEAFYKFHFMHLAVRVCRTDHNDSIIARIACSFLLN